MKLSFVIFIFLLLALVSCNNSGTTEQHQDSAGQSSSLPPETNYVMENNVSKPVKKNTDVFADTTTNQMMAPAVDSAIPYLVDSASVKK